MDDANDSAATSAAAPSLYPPTDSAGSGTPQATPDLLAKLDAATDRAIDQTGSSAKRKSGQRGPDKAKRKPGSGGPRVRLPVDDMGGSSAEALLAEGDTIISPPDWQAAPAGLDDETAEALADVVFELFKDGRENFWKVKVFQVTGNRGLADTFITPISPKLETAMRKSAKLLVMKYGANIEYAPEITFLGAAAVIVVSDFLRFRGIKKDAEEIRSRPSAA